MSRLISIQMAVLRRDLMLGWRGLADTVAGLSFFIMIIASDWVVFDWPHRHHAACS